MICGVGNETKRFTNQFYLVLNIIPFSLPVTTWGESCIKRKKCMSWLCILVMHLFIMFNLCRHLSAIQAEWRRGESWWNGSFMAMNAGWDLMHSNWGLAIKNTSECREWVCFLAKPSTRVHQILTSTNYHEVTHFSNKKFSSFRRLCFAPSAHPLTFLVHAITHDK